VTPDRCADGPHVVRPPIEADHGRLKHWLRPCGVAAPTAPQSDHQPVGDLAEPMARRHELATETHRQLRVAAAFTELASAIRDADSTGFAVPAEPMMQQHLKNV